MNKGAYKVRGYNLAIGIKYNFSKTTDLYFEKYDEFYQHNYTPHASIIFFTKWRK